jgi:membrane protease YdiL (CAAX protease family)
MDLLGELADFFTRKVSFWLFGEFYSIEWFKIAIVLGFITFMLAVLLNARGPQKLGPLGFFKLVITGPIIEEIIFRLMLIPFLYVVFGSAIIAIGASAFLFALGHIVYGGMRFVDSFITGLLWGWAFIMLGIEVTIVAHMTHNFLAALTGG